MAKARQETEFQVNMELPTVTTSAVDTFYAPPKLSVDPSINALANSLSSIVPSLRRYSIQQDELAKEEAKGEAAVAFRKNNMKSFKQAVKEGKIPEGANPYFVEAYVQQELIQKAKQFKDELYAAWKNEGIANNTAPNAFEEFFARKSAEFKDSQKLDGYDPSDIASAFIPNAEAARASLFERHINTRIEVIETENRKLLSNNTISAIENNIDASGTFDISGLGQDLTKISADLISRGMNGNDVNSILIDTISQQASDLENEDVLDVLSEIKTATGTLADTAYAKEKVEQAENEILTKQIRKWNWENAKDDRELREYRENTVASAIGDINKLATVDVNKDGEINIADGIVNFDLEKYIRDNNITDGATVASLYQITNTIISAQDNVIDDKDYINQILIKMNNNIHDPDLMKEILDGMGKEYSVSRGLQIFNDYTRKRTDGQHYYMQGAGFKQLESSLRTAIKKDSLFTEDVAMAEVAVFELNDFAAQWVIDNPQGTKKDFNKAVRDEWSDILKVYVSEKNWSDVEAFRKKINDEDNIPIDNNEINNSAEEQVSSIEDNEINPFANKESFQKVEELENKTEKRESLKAELKSLQAQIFEINQKMEKINNSPKKNEVASNALLAPLIQKKSLLTAEISDVQKQLEGFK